jgi:hypothetical protein
MRDFDGPIIGIIQDQQTHPRRKKMENGSVLAKMLVAWRKVEDDGE